jgi:signal transduction histidine kinase
MSSLCIVCVDADPATLKETAAALRDWFGDSHTVIESPSGKQAITEIQDLARRDKQLALVMVTQEVQELTGDQVLASAQQSFPRAMKVLVTEGTNTEVLRRLGRTTGLDQCIQKPWEPQALYLAVRSLLKQYELAGRLHEHQGALERKNTHWEALHRVGVALAGSFDIDSILRQMAGAVSQLLGDTSLDIFYTGSRNINARSRWLPSSPSSSQLSSASRKELEKKVLSVAESARAGEPSEIDNLERLLAKLPERDRKLIPISRNEELLGLLVIKMDRAIDSQVLDLLSILTLQAATALQNIHLTQERIHFERLSAFGQMIGSLVHDFRSPLTAVRGYAGMLGGNDLEALERHEYAELAIDECDRLNAMINELLDYTRGGRSTLQTEAVGLASYIEELQPAIHAELEENRIHVEIELAYDGPLQLDPERMKRAVMNVVANAGQAMNGSGELKIRTERRDDRIVVEFTDTGSGIPDEIRHRIFDPFFSHGKAQGIGLGMAITRKIVEEHGGEVEVTSEPGKGTCVRFLLPLTPVAERRSTPVGSH